MKVVSAREMQEIDKKTIRNYGIPGHVLMEQAGAVMAAKVKELFRQGKIVVVAGGGNNGGDGIVVARELFHAGWDVHVLLLAKENSLSPDCRHQFKVAKQAGVDMRFRTRVTHEDLKGAVVVDALFGTGLSRDVKDEMARVISSLNRSASPVISVDIPSGISADSGQVMGVAVKADYTVTFGLPKRGHLLHPGAEYTGRLFVENIGFPEKLLESDAIRVELPEKDFLSHLIPARQVNSHKGDYGHVLVVAGSRGKTGAALMAAKACMRAGAGLVTIGIPESLMDVLQCRVTEEMTLPLPDRGDGSLSSKALDAILAFVSEKADVLAIGAGIGVSDETRRLMSGIILSARVPLVVDADGINALSETKGREKRVKALLKKAQAPIILTPHSGEMARLLQGTGGTEKGGRNIPISALRALIEGDRITTAQTFSKETGTLIVLKGVPTIIAEPEGRSFINTTGNPGMATAGTGDVLTGIIASFLAQGLNPLSSAILGPFLHGLAGDIAGHEIGQHSLIASDIIQALPAAFREFKR